MIGQNSDVIDVQVGLDLFNWGVYGGIADQGGVISSNVNVGKNINGFDVAHGIFNDYITAGVAIQNSATGADGIDAVFDTEIRAGIDIVNVVFGGNVESDHVTNPNGRQTRIIAGEDRAGNFNSGGNIQGLIIEDSLINAAVIAAVKPFTGNTPPPGSNNYAQPGGGIYRFASGGFANGGVPYAAPPFADPNASNTVLAGSINKSFAPALNAAAPAPGYIPLPSETTVFGSVISTAHTYPSDYAGFFAADTSGVYVGTIPK